MSPSAVVECTDVRRRFNGREVLSGINMTIAAGEVVALLGRSGSGKSTLLRALAGLDKGIEGAIVAPERRAVVFQQPRLLPWERTLNNVVLGLTGEDRIQRGRAALAEVGLADRARAWPMTLSGGEAQRVALARALVREPELVLLDEPFGALDALTRIQMQSLLQGLIRMHSPSVLLVTHDVDEALVLADRIFVLTDGVLSAPLDLTGVDDRRPGSASFISNRTHLLSALGVDTNAMDS